MRKLRTLADVVAAMPADRQARIEARTQQLIKEETALRRVREARGLTQVTMARLLDMDQAGISKLENRTDMLLSTLRSYVMAMGGSLRLTAEFPDGAVDLVTIGEAEGELPKKRRAPTRDKLLSTEAR